MTGNGTQWNSPGQVSQKSCCEVISFSYIYSNSLNFARWSGERGKLFVDQTLMGEGTSFGNTNHIEVEPEFYLGGVRQEMREDDTVMKNVMVSKMW